MNQADSLWVPSGERCALTVTADPRSFPISFCAQGETVLTLDRDGFVYKGERINDAGAAHKAWLEVMDRMGR